MAIDELAKKRWEAIPDHERKMLEGNVFCSTCGVTTIVDYHVESSHYQILLKGKCQKCQGDVARVID